LKGDEIVRVYRGTGNFQLISYDPYTRSTTRFAEDLEHLYDTTLIVDEKATEAKPPQAVIWSNLTTIEESPGSFRAGTAADDSTRMAFGKTYLLDSSSLPSNKKYGNFTGTHYRIYNNGAIAAPVEMYISLQNMSSAGRTIKLSNSATTKMPLEIFIASAQCA
jgi:hypothetical protein